MNHNAVLLAYRVVSDIMWDHSAMLHDKTASALCGKYCYKTVISDDDSVCPEGSHCVSITATTLMTITAALKAPWHYSGLSMDKDKSDVSLHQNMGWVYMTYKLTYRQTYIKRYRQTWRNTHLRTQTHAHTHAYVLYAFF